MKKKTKPVLKGNGTGMEVEAFSGGLDQPMKIKAVSFKATFTTIDSVLSDAKASKSDVTVNHLLQNFATASQVIGVSLAKLLYGTLQIWPDITGVEYKDMNDRRMHFTQTMFSKFGYSKERVERYLLAWEFIERHNKRLDPATKERFLSRPIKDLIALGQNCRENADFTAAQLKKLAAAEDNGTLRKEIAKIRTGSETNSDVMSFTVGVDGTVTAWEGKERADIGYIASADPGDDDPKSLRLRAIARLKRKGQIKEID